RLPCIRLAIVLPSSRRLTTIFLPRFGSLETTRRPVDRASAVLIETAYMRVRIRTILHVEMYFDFILHIISVGTRFWTSGCLFTRTPYGAARGLEIFRTAFNYLKREHAAGSRTASSND